MTVRLLLAALCLSACAADNIDVAVSEQAAGGQVSYVGPVLAQAKRDFFGSDGGGSSGGGGSGGGFGLAETVTVRGGPPTVAALALSRRDAVGRGWQVWSTLTLAHAEVRATLPDGLGVLTDPMQVDIWAGVAQAQVTLGRRQDLSQGWVLDYGAGLGVQQIAARAHLQSALIELRSRVDLTEAYAIVSGRLANPFGSGLTGDVLLFDSGGAEYRLGLVQAF